MASRRQAAVAAVGAMAIAGTAFSAGFFYSRRPPVSVRTLHEPARVPVVASSSTVRQAAGLSEAFIQIAQAVTPAVVRIETERSMGHQDGFVPRWMRDFANEDSAAAWEDLPELAGGTGIILSDDGYILTNNHVVAGADRVTVSLSDKRRYEAEVVGLDPTTDLAVIRVPAVNLPAASLGDSDDTRVGEWVLTVGNPGFGEEETLDFTVTSGIISAKGRPLRVIEESMDAQDPVADYTIEDFIQTDAVINPGNSGGPLVNLSGMVIGVNTAIATSTGFNQGYGFAIPSNLARRVARDLIEHGRVRRPVMGVSIAEVDPEDAEVYRLPSITGVLVYDFASGSPAADAGLKRHDVITAVDGRRVDRVGHLQRVIAQREPGDTVRLSVIRYGDSLSVTVHLTEAHLPEKPVERGPDAPATPDLGLRLADMDRTTAKRLGFTEASGVLVADVLPYSPADRKGVQPGMKLVAVGDKRVANAAEARTLIRATPSGEVISLLFENAEGRTRIANVRNP
jgi:serine protease Do